MFILAAFHLPNRQYYPNLRDETLDSLLAKISNVLVYRGLELISFLLLQLLLYRQLQLSAAHHVAFVLETNWRLIQPKLILWILIVMQQLLEHYGTCIPSHS